MACTNWGYFIYLKVGVDMVFKNVFCMPLLLLAMWNGRWRSRPQWKISSTIKTDTTITEQGSCHHLHSTKMDAITKKCTYIPSLTSERKSLLSSNLTSSRPGLRGTMPCHAPEIVHTTHNQIRHPKSHTLWQNVLVHLRPVKFLHPPKTNSVHNKVRVMCLCWY